jgi:hypothetical protein
MILVTLTPKGKIRDEKERERERERGGQVGFLVSARFARPRKTKKTL